MSGIFPVRFRWYEATGCGDPSHCGAHQTQPGTTDHPQPLPGTTKRTIDLEVRKKKTGTFRIVNYFPIIYLFGQTERLKIYLIFVGLCMD